MYRSSCFPVFLRLFILLHKLHQETRKSILRRFMSITFFSSENPNTVSKECIVPRKVLVSQ